MRRREFLSLVGGAATWPLAARAQQPPMPVIGYLYGGGARPPMTSLAAFQKGLGDEGYHEGHNVTLEWRGTARTDQLLTLAADLVHLRVGVIVATGTVNAAQAAVAATETIPIVFGNGSDPVRMRPVASMNRPGGNATGVSYYTAALNMKRLELLRELVPGASSIAILVNPASARAKEDRQDIAEAARQIGQEVLVVGASAAAEIDAVFALIAKQAIPALLVASDAFFNNRSEQFAALAAYYRIPASYGSRDYAVAGGLMSYGDDRRESYRQVGLYAGRVLKGEKPADMPVLQPTKFEFVINLKTAKALGITFPPSFHLRADEVIE